MADNEFLTAQVTIKANLERLKADLSAAKKEVYRTVDELSARAAKGDVDKLAKRSALIHQRDIKDQIKAENDLLRGLRDRETQNNKIAREHRRAVNDMIQDLKRFSREAFLIGAGISAAMGYTIKKYADAEKAMRSATARADTTLSQAAFEELARAADRMAVRFNLSVQQISRGFEVLKKSGYATPDQLNLLPTIAALAKGTETELGLTATKLLDVMNVFDIGMDQLDTTVNYLAYGTANARTSLADLMEGLLSIGNIATLTSNDFKDMNAMLLLMAQAGSEGAAASRALRRILSDLTDESSKGAVILGDYIDTYNHFADGTSAMKPFKQIIDELSIALSKVDETTRNTVLTKWFDENALAGGLALFKGGSKLIDEFADRLESAGAAAQTLLDNQLKALWEQLGILYQQLQAVVRQIGAGLTPAIEKINTIIRPYLNALKEWMELNPQIVSSMSEWVAGLGIALVTLGGLGLSIQAVTYVLSPFISVLKLVAPVAGAAITSFGLLGGELLIIAGAIYIFRAAWKQNANGIKPLLEGIGNDIKSMLNNAKENLKAFWSWLTENFSAAWESVRTNTKPALAGLAADLMTTFTGMMGRLEIIKEGIGKYESARSFTQARDAIRETFEDLNNYNTNAWEENYQTALKGLDKTTDAVKSGYESTALYLKALTIAVGESAADLWEATSNQFKADLDSLISMLTSKFPQFTGLLEKYRAEVTEGIGAGSPFGGGDPRGPEIEFTNWQRGLQKYYTEINKWDAFVQESVKQTAHGIEGALGDAFAKVGYEANTFREVINELFTSIDLEIRRFMGQLTARAVMKGTIEHFFPDLAGVFDPATAQLQMAGTTLQLAGTTQIQAGAGLSIAATSLTAAAAALGASGGIGITGGLLGGLVGAGGSFGNAGGADMVMGSFAHRGGTVGSMAQTPMPISLFANAPRFHKGFNLRSDEFPTILEKGERVIPKEGESDKQTSTVVINVSSIDAAGTFQFLSKNKRTIASMLQDTMNKNHTFRRRQ